MKYFVGKTRKVVDTETINGSLNFAVGIRQKALFSYLI